MDRDEILDAIVQRVTVAGGTLLMPVKELASELGEKPERLYYLIRSFQDKGQLRTTSRGPKGMEVRLGEEDGGDRKVARRAKVAPAASAARFCPFCGRPAEANWRFCASCGEALPAAH